jgi:hypothetical protein
MNMQIAGIHLRHLMKLNESLFRDTQLHNPSKSPDIDKL